MVIIAFLTQLLSGAMLLLFAVSFMRIGVERLWTAQIRERLGEQVPRFSLVANGIGLGFVMQGATVVILMAAGLAQRGAIPLLSAVLVAIGADLGSALAVRFLSLPVSGIGPFAVLAGAWLYLRSSNQKTASIGRLGLGLGLIFLSLSVIRDAVEPLNTVPVASGFADYLNKDPVSAAILGLALTLIMQSSLAAILTCVAYAAGAALELSAGLAVVLGCNIGSALLPLWLLRADKGLGLVVAQSVALLRISLAAILIAGLASGTAPLPFGWANSPEQVMLTGHLAFNLLLLAFSPFAIRMAGFLAPSDEARSDVDVLSQRVSGKPEPHLTRSAMRAQLTKMLEMVSEMFEISVDDNPDSSRMAALEDSLNSALSELRSAYSKLPPLTGQAGGDLTMLLNFAIRVEGCGDILSGKTLKIRLEGLQGDYEFSDAGKQEIELLAAAVRKGILMAQSLSWTGNVEEARALVSHKQFAAKLEAESREKHLKRIRSGNEISLSSSNHHLEMIAAMKSVNSKLATIGYALLDREGGLKKTRLKSAAAQART